MKIHSELIGATIYPDDNLLAFWGGIFSNFAECEIDYPQLETKLNCSEQGYMLYKAQHFCDDEAFQGILKAKTPREQKNIGRQVQGFDAKEWHKVCFNYMTNVVRAKFEQAFTWRELLILTYPLEIAEASPVDKIWGIGMSECDPTIVDRSKWEGENLLGKVLMKVREEFILKSFIEL